MTTWQRLNIALAILVFLLLVGCGIALWIQDSYTSAVSQSDQLLLGQERIFSGLAQTSEALRGLMLDPTSEFEQTRLKKAKEDLVRDMGKFQTTFTNWSGVFHAATNLNAYTQQTNLPFQKRMVAMLATNPPGAVADYTNESPAIVLASAALMKDLDQKTSDVKKALTQNAFTKVVWGCGAIVLVFLVGVRVAWRESSAVTQPLNKLVAALERMRGGDFTERLALDRQDEFGMLGDGLNRLADDLSGIVGQVQRSGISVNTAATEIAATAREQQSTANEIAATTAQIGATSKEISATSKELVKTMNEVNEVAEDTAKVAGSGQSAIGRMESNMHQIMEASGAISGKLAVLNEKTANINTVVTTITKVADQTNLLSLNAAIEAEKAGEYGLGFAVVAMEIRRLADQTAVATYDIEKMVKEMQSAVAAGVMGMDKFSEEVRRGVEEIRQVSGQLAQIIQQVQTLTPRFQTVNEGMHAQATGAQQISETLIQLSEAAQQTADSLRQFNMTIEQLNGAARGLQTSVARFKLGT